MNFIKSLRQRYIYNAIEMIINDDGIEVKY